MAYHTLHPVDRRDHDHYWSDRRIGLVQLQGKLGKPRQAHISLTVTSGVTSPSAALPSSGSPGRSPGPRASTPLPLAQTSPKYT